MVVSRHRVLCLGLVVYRRLRGYACDTVGRALFATKPPAARIAAGFGWMVPTLVGGPSNPPQRTDAMANNDAPTYINHTRHGLRRVHDHCAAVWVYVLVGFVVAGAAALVLCSHRRWCAKRILGCTRKWGDDASDSDLLDSDGDSDSDGAASEFEHGRTPMTATAAWRQKTYTCAFCAALDGTPGCATKFCKQCGAAMGGAGVADAGGKGVLTGVSSSDAEFADVVARVTATLPHATVDCVHRVTVGAGRRARLLCPLGGRTIHFVPRGVVTCMRSRSSCHHGIRTGCRFARSHTHTSCACHHTHTSCHRRLTTACHCTCTHPTVVLQNENQAKLFQANVHAMERSIGADWDEEKMRLHLFHGTDKIEPIINSTSGHGFLPQVGATLRVFVSARCACALLLLARSCV